MGAEQSSNQQQQSANASGGAIPRTRPVALPQRHDESGRNSPHPSVGSDADIPYVSYTINKPIGGN